MGTAKTRREFGEGNADELVQGKNKEQNRKSQVKSRAGGEQKQPKGKEVNKR